MTKREKILTIVAFFQTVAIALLIVVIVRIRFIIREVSSNNYVNYVHDVSEEDEETVEKLDLPFKVSAHLVWWDQDKGVESIEENAKYIYSISPFWYELDLEGNIVSFSGAEDEEVIEMLDRSDIKVVPVISNEFKDEPLSSIIANSSEKATHIQAIVNLSEDYDGISLNYENLNESDRDNYSLFVASLAEELHKKDKTLSVHLHAKTEEPGTWNGPQAQDWEALGEAADKLKIMAYDYHWSTSEAGAIAPPDWVEDVVEFAVTKIPKEKIYLGIPLYGYDWVDEQGEGVTFKQVTSLSDMYSENISFDTSAKSPYFSYTDKEEVFHEVWFENAQSVSYKLELAKTYDIAGVDFWRLGGEDEGVWSEVGKIPKE